MAITDHRAIVEQPDESKRGQAPVRLKITAESIRWLNLQKNNINTLKRIINYKCQESV